MRRALLAILLAVMTPVSALAEGGRPPGTEGESALPRSSLGRAAWLAGAATLVLGTAAALSGLAAESREDDLRRRAEFVDPMSRLPLDWNAGATAADWGRLHDEGERFNAVAAGLALGAGAALVTTCVLLYLDRDSAVVPVVGTTGVGLGAAARF